MLTVNEVANFFIRQPDNQAGDFMTHLKLQKLVYYAQAWSLVLRGKPLFEGRLEAWAHGPVSPELYTRFRDRRFDAILVHEGTDPEDAPQAEADELEVLEEVWAEYGEMSAKHLENLTHSEMPWIEARGGLPLEARSKEEIKLDTMAAFYSARMAELSSEGQAAVA